MSSETYIDEIDGLEKDVRYYQELIASYRSCPQGSERFKSEIVHLQSQMEHAQKQISYYQSCE